MTHAEKAVALHRSGFNCGQSVFAAYAEELGLSEGAATRLFEGLGGGFCGHGEVCGALMGAMAVLGMREGRERADDAARKQAARAAGNALIDAFRAAHGDTHCLALLGMDISSPEGSQRAREAGLFTGLCTGIVARTCELLDKEK